MEAKLSTTLDKDSKKDDPLVSLSTYKELFSAGGMLNSALDSMASFPTIANEQS